MTQPDGERRDARQYPSGGGSSASSDAMGSGAGTTAGTGAAGGDDSREKQASNGDDGSADDGNWLAEKAHMGSLTREETGDRPASGHTHRREARA